MHKQPSDQSPITDLQTQQLLALSVAYIMCDAALVITETSAGVPDLLGLTEDVLPGQALTSVCLPLLGYEAHLYAICDRTLPNLVIEQINFEDRHGETRYVSLVVLPQESEPGLVILLSDVTLQSQQQQRLQQQHHELLLLHEKIAAQNTQLVALNAELSQLSQRKSDMMAIVTHDLRSPLTAITGYARMLLDGMYGQLLPEQQELVQSMYDQGQHMRELLSKLLDLRRLESTELQKREVVNLNLLLTRVVFSFHDHARLAAVELCLAEDDEMLITHGDGDILQQAVANLVSNAIKYTGAGGKVVLRLARLTELPTVDPPLDASHTWGALTVSDTGSGIAEEDLQHIFDPFFRTAAARMRGPAGSGLGLSIVQMAMHQHGGRVLVASRLDEGTTFTLLLPCNTQDQAALKH